MHVEWQVHDVQPPRPGPAALRAARRRAARAVLHVRRLWAARVRRRRRGSGLEGCNHGPHSGREALAIHDYYVLDCAAVVLAAHRLDAARELGLAGRRRHHRHHRWLAELVVQLIRAFRFLSRRASEQQQQQQQQRQQQLLCRWL